MPLPRWDLRQYFFDVLTRNHSPGRVAFVLFRGSFRWIFLHGLRLLTRVRGGYALHLWLSRWTTGKSNPYVCGRLLNGSTTPSEHLDLRPGEFVRIKPQREIEKTLDGDNKNRGLSFDAEMVPFCGGVFKVRDRVSRLIDERTGKMLTMKQPCIMLEGVACKADFSSCRLLCPRAIPPYWREIWLERVSEAPARAESGRRLSLELASRAPTAS
jgi:hypothetical protein